MEQVLEQVLFILEVLPQLLQILQLLSEEPQVLSKSSSAVTTVKMDFLAKPLPEIPLPNDIATRYDPTSATGLRINASMLAPTQLERIVRQKIDQVDGWGINQPITIPFTGPLDIQSILDGHRDYDYDLSNVMERQT